MVGHIVNNGQVAIMESLVGYGSDDESGENYQDNKVNFVKIYTLYIDKYTNLL
jgi:hypothetical protein